MSRALALQALALAAGVPRPDSPVPLPIRADCADGKCRQCHSCRGTLKVPVMIRIRKEAQP